MIAIPKEYAIIGQDILKKYKVIIDTTDNSWRIEKSENKEKNKK